jgi:hypothetical protein
MRHPFRKLKAHCRISTPAAGTCTASKSSSSLDLDINHLMEFMECVVAGDEADQQLSERDPDVAP